LFANRPSAAVPPVSTEPPVAYIDSVSAATVAEGQTVSFIGHGTVANGSIVAIRGGPIGME